MTKSDLIDIYVVKVVETEKALGIKELPDDEEVIWLPKSLIEFLPGKEPGSVMVTLPEYLALDKGLI